MKRCIVNFANGSWYKNGQKRLIEACKIHFSGDLLTFDNYNEIGSPSHKENPYAFKLYCIDKAINLGYTTILYCDSSIYPIKNINSVFDYIEEHGHLMQLCGASVDRWCNDNCRKYFNLSHEESNGMEMYSAGFTGIYITNIISMEFFNKWFESCKDGAFKGSWTDHRHDMTCASIIANRLGMSFEKKIWMAYIGIGYNKPPEESFFYCHPC